MYLIRRLNNGQRSKKANNNNNNNNMKPITEIIHNIHLDDYEGLLWETNTGHYGLQIYFKTQAGM